MVPLELFVVVAAAAAGDILLSLGGGLGFEAGLEVAWIIFSTLRWQGTVRWAYNIALLNNQQPYKYKTAWYMIICHYRCICTIHIASSQRERKTIGASAGWSPLEPVWEEDHVGQRERKTIRASERGRPWEPVSESKTIGANEREEDHWSAEDH